MTSQDITRRGLNRATLARQMLLEREEIGVIEAVERLGGLQAQLARPPAVALWSRLTGFEIESLTALLGERALVRATFYRCTLHTVTRGDYLAFRASLQPVLTAAMSSTLRARASALDVPRLVEEARAFFLGKPATFEEARDHLAALHPDGDARAMGYAVRTHLPLVQVPGDDRFGFPAAASFADAAEWLGEPLREHDARLEIVRRYLRSFGPATPADAQAWSGLRGLREVFAALGDELIELEDESGRRLWDLVDAPRPAEDVVAPVRFLPDFDSLVLAHADRTRLMTEEHHKLVVTKNLRVLPTYLVNGEVAGTWQLVARGKRAKLALRPFVSHTKKTKRDLEREGAKLLVFLEPAVAETVVVFED